MRISISAPSTATECELHILGIQIGEHLIRLSVAYDRARRHLQDECRSVASVFSICPAAFSVLRLYDFFMSKV